MKKHTQITCNINPSEDWDVLCDRYDILKEKLQDIKERVLLTLKLSEGSYEQIKRVISLFGMITIDSANVYVIRFVKDEKVLDTYKKFELDKNFRFPLVKSEILLPLITENGVF